MARYTFLAVILLLYIQSSSGEESAGFIRDIFNSVAREMLCEDVTECAMRNEESYGCHLYSNVEASNAESCLVKSYSAKSPTVYMKPGKDFEYLELNLFNSRCTSKKTWKLTSDLFPDHSYWYEVKVIPNKSQWRYQLFIDGKEENGLAEYYRSINITHIQIMVKGSALWSYECDPKDYYASREFPIVPWTLFFILAFLLVIILVGIIVYCLKKLKKQNRRLNDCNSIKISAKSTISISSPVKFQNRSYDFRGSSTSCNQDWSQSHGGASASGFQKWSSNPAGNTDLGAQKWSYNAASNAGQEFKKWSQLAGSNSQIGFENYSSNPYRNSLAEHIYEDPEENIYSEIDDYGPAVFMGNSRQPVDQKPIVPYSREDSRGSAFSTANSLYGYR